VSDECCVEDFGTRFEEASKASVDEVQRTQLLRIDRPLFVCFLRVEALFFLVFEEALQSFKIHAQQLVLFCEGLHFLIFGKHNYVPVLVCIVDEQLLCAL